MEDLLESLNKLSINNLETKSVIIIQKWFRGNNQRNKNLPLILLYIKKYLLNNKIIFSKDNEDGRINSSIDEEIIIKELLKKFKDNIFIPKSRMWYDLLVKDYIYGWLPVNIKTTTTITSDNVGNLATCVYAYTNLKLNLKKSYQNGKMAKILLNKIKNKEYNKINKKDYYFLVLNKNNNNEIIINSLKGLTIVQPNINNLPFQVCWNKNKFYKYKKIDDCIKLLVNSLKKPKPSWKEEFLSNIRNINI